MDKRRFFFEQNAFGWDNNQKREVLPERLLELVGLISVHDGDHILDVGCGTGILLPYLFQAIGKGRLIAIDFSFNMIKVAHGRYGHMAISFINGSVSTIPIREGIFDKVICFSAFPHFPNKKKACDEMARVLKHGGRLYIAHTHSSKEIEHLHREIGGAVGGDTLPEPNIMEELLHGSGFTHISVIDESGRYLACGTKR